MKYIPWTEEVSRRDGKTYTARVGSFQLVVTNQHIDWVGIWIGACYGLFDNTPLDVARGDGYARDAQEALMTMVMIELKQVVDALQGMQTSK